ncbi:MAG: GNAT family N-acetyltransferase [Planctomycetota bacterium]
MTMNDASPEQFQTVVAGLRTFNKNAMAEFEHESFCAFVREDDGNIIGGVLGELSQGEFYVGICWIEEAHRGQGHGTAALLRAEEEAAQRGCKLAFLDTFDFQARPFYEKLGYEVIGRYTHPVGAERYFMTKELSVD